jgi:hypothetical protein
MKRNNAMLLVSIVVFSFLQSCNSAGTSGKIGEHQYRRLLNFIGIKKEQPLIIYYFDGDCTMCIAKVKNMQDSRKRFDGAKMIFIARTANPIVMRFNLNNVAPDAEVAIDNSDLLLDVLPFNKISKLNTDRTLDEDFEEQNFSQVK